MFWFYWSAQDENKNETKGQNICTQNTMAKTINITHKTSGESYTNQMGKMEKNNISKKTELNSIILIQCYASRGRRRIYRKKIKETKRKNKEDKEKTLFWNRIESIRKWSVNVSEVFGMFMSNALLYSVWCWRRYAIRCFAYSVFCSCCMCTQRLRMLFAFFVALSLEAKPFTLTVDASIAVHAIEYRRFRFLFFYFRTYFHL